MAEGLWLLAETCDWSVWVSLTAIAISLVTLGFVWGQNR